jgi:DNA-directed RNA polymerase subunit RPC12/RpoP
MSAIRHDATATEGCRMISTITRCIDCGGKIPYGETVLGTTTTFNERTKIEYRCHACAENYAEALWPEEEWGPYPGIQDNRKE